MRWLNNVKTTMLLAALMGLCMGIGYLFGGPRGLTIGFLFGGVGNLVAFFFSDRIALAAMQAQEVAPDDLPWLHQMVERLAARAGLPKPRVYVCPQPAPNAFATGRSPRHAAVAVTQGLLRGFPQQEIEGVLAHELAHVKHRDVLISTVAAVMAGAIAYAGYVFFWFGGGRRDGENSSPFGAIGALLALILAPVAAALIQAAISRQREYAADSYGGELCGDPNRLANALARLGMANERISTETNPALHSMFIVQPLSGKSIASLGDSHPPLEKRIAALRAQASRGTGF